MRKRSRARSAIVRRPSFDAVALAKNALGQHLSTNVFVPLEDLIVSELLNTSLHCSNRPGARQLEFLSQSVIRDDNHRIGELASAGEECIHHFPRRSPWV